jgi:hypothetical protein
VTIAEPGRDTKVTRLEEVFASVEAEDDYGVARVELVYSVNGGAEQTVALHQAGARRTPEVTAGHTFFLEELPLKPGDVVSYYARARDNDAVSGAHSAATDIYFLQVRPFGQNYRQAEQQGGGGGGGPQESPNALSERQREIVAATHKVVRDAGQTPERQRREDLATLALSQSRLREQVERLAERVRQRGGAAPDSALRQIAEALPLAVAAMREAEERLGKRQPNDALPAEQRALQQLQRAEAAYRDVEVSMGAQQGGGGGGGNTRPEDLADLFGLEADKLRNQYESVQRSGGSAPREQANAEVDRTLERLRELAARQQRESERMRREAEALRQRTGSGGGGSGGGEGQRQLAQQAEELARTLERLSRETQSPELRQSARQLQEAADQMRRSAAAGGDAAAASAASARDRIESARRALDNTRSARAENDTRQLQRRAQQLAEEQRRVGAAAERLAGGEGRGTQAEAQVLTQKDSLAGAVAALERDLDRAARDARREQPDAARRLQEAANAIRDTRVLDKLRFSKNVARGGSPEYVRNIEEQIASNLDDVRDRVNAAAGAVREPGTRRSAQAVDRARELAEGMESLGERMRQRREQGGRQLAQSGQPGAPGQAGQQGQRGQAGQQGQGGQQGQQGQQGQGGQQGQSGQGQGGQGQQGQQGQGGQGGGQGSREGGSISAAAGTQYGGGDARPGASRGSPTSGGFSAEDARQFGREMQARRGDAEELRRLLAQQGIQTGDLESLIARMRALEGQRAYDDPEEAERLQAAVIEGLKAFEFALRRRVDGPQGDQLRLGGSDEVPAGFRALVDEYYKSLARVRR